MAEFTGPSLVRRDKPAYYAKPGLHSHNIRRRPQQTQPVDRPQNALSIIRTVLLVIGLLGIGYYCYSVADQDVYQAYQNWVFDQQIAGRRNVVFSDYVREQTPFGFIVGTKPAPNVLPQHQPETAAPRPVMGSVVGRVEIPRLGIAAMVREGVDAKTLSIAVGHVPSTALAGETGNFAIAAHRDTLFRGLKDVRKGDLVTFRSPAGTYTYQVVATKIVWPSDVSVLRPDGGGVIPFTEVSTNTQPNKLLTMITCYPFYYVGSAPKRFIVEARLVSNDPDNKFTTTEASYHRPTLAHGKKRHLRNS